MGFGNDSFTGVDFTDTHTHTHMHSLKNHLVKSVRYISYEENGMGWFSNTFKGTLYSNTVSIIGESRVSMELLWT